MFYVMDSIFFSTFSIELLIFTLTHFFLQLLQRFLTGISFQFISDQLHCFYEPILPVIFWFSFLFCWPVSSSNLFIKVMGRILEKPLIVGKYLLLTSYRSDIFGYALQPHIVQVPWRSSLRCIFQKFNNMSDLLNYFLVITIIILLVGERDFLKKQKNTHAQSAFLNEVNFLNFFEKYSFKLSLSTVLLLYSILTI